MERLTYWSKIVDDEARIKGSMIETSLDWSNIAQECIDRLAAYEDTGLTPEEIKNDIRVHKELWEEKIKEINHWIPVSERLPDNEPSYIRGTTYHITLNTGIVKLAKYKEFKWIGDFGKVFSENVVVAWKPLPKPYKGVSKT